MGENRERIEIDQHEIISVTYLKKIGHSSKREGWWWRGGNPLEIDLGGRVNGGQGLSLALSEGDERTSQV